MPAPEWRHSYGIYNPEWVDVTENENCGAIEFTDDDHGVKSLSPHGYFIIEEGNWFSGHRVLR